MPRQARLDAPGTLHHVIIRVIERKEIVKDDHDRQNFVYRMVTIALETGTLIHAWTLMTNHAHFFFAQLFIRYFPVYAPPVIWLCYFI
jgi:REP element-mobilizing transposase RayT